MADLPVKSTFIVISIFLLWVKTSPAFLTVMAGDSLKPGDMLNSTTKLCSAANRFCLQFHNYGGKGIFSYLALYNQMLYNQIGYCWPLWIGNRNEPVAKNYGELSLDDSGELKIVSQGKSIRVLYSPIQPINNTKAILLDNGNFVLQQLHPNGSTKAVLWQSFDDYPTYALLPGMKLGVNHKTGHKWSLVSWRNCRNPSVGDFNLEWEPKRRELIFRRRGVIFWRSGELINNGSFENIPNELIHRFEVVATEDEDYFTLTTLNSTEVSFLALNYDGSLYDGIDRVIASADTCHGYNSAYSNFTDIQNVMDDTGPELLIY